MESEKRIRSANFTSEEKMLCLNLVRKYKGIIECKKTDAVTWKEKEEAWKKIEKEFNIQSPSANFRTHLNLKKFFDNKKKETRKVVAAEKKHLMQTGGGQHVTNNDPLVDITLSIINEKTVLGFVNQFDDDFETNTGISTAERKLEIVYEGSSDGEQQEVHGLKRKVDWGKIKPQDLKNPVNPKLIPSTSYGIEASAPGLMNKILVGERENFENVIDEPLTFRHQVIPDSSEHKELTTETNWHNRRRPSVANTSKTANIHKKYEDLLELRKNNALLQHEILELELKEKKLKILREAEMSEQFNLKKKRDEELYQLQKKSLLLDIELRKEKLNIL